MPLELTLRLRYHDQPLRPAAAWFVAGERAEDWLQELAGWKTPLAQLKLYVVPRAADDLRPCGVLVVGHAGEPGQSHLPRPYGCLGALLYLPVEGRLEPAITDAELAGLLNPDQTHVWHPAAGLVAFDPRHALRVCDLLSPPALRENLWNAARQGVALPARLLSIAPESQPDLMAMLREGGDDIGTQAPQLSDLPPAPGERRPGATGQAGRAVAQGMASALAWLTSKAPHTALQPTWVNSVEDWANRQFEKWGASLDAERNRELQRLLHLLKSDPDEGLKFALPMDPNSHRGLAPPSARLGERNTDFDLRRLGGGGPGDAWNISPDYQRRLSERYRELANREIALGRYRRAAYIFAELLADLSSAAATLADGGHFREAAALYDQRLQQPLKAAQCLERGGLWTEAIALYERLGNHEQVGDLYRQLDQLEPARLAYRRAVEARLAAKDNLAAAVLLENKLAATEEALACLWDGWTQSPQRARCLAESFTLLARLPDHDRAAEQVAELRESVRPLDHLLVAQGLAHVATAYPDADVRGVAADGARLIVSCRLDQDPPFDEAQSLTAAIASLAPADKLLDRDCRRYAERQRPLRIAAPRAAPTCSIVREFALPPHDWSNAILLDDGVFAVGYSRESSPSIVLACLDHRGEVVSGSWGVPRHSSHTHYSGIMLSSRSDDATRVAIRRLFAVHMPADYEFPATSSRRAITVGAHHSTPRTVALSFGAEGVFNCIEVEEGSTLVLKSFGPTGTLLGSVRLDGPRMDDHRSRAALPSFVRGSTCFFAVGPRAYVVAGRYAELLFETQTGMVHHLTGSPLHTRARIVAGCERGGVIVWGDRASDPSQTFAMDMTQPVVGLTRDGWVVAATRTQTQLYDAHHEQLRLGATFATGGDGNTSEPIAVLPLREADRFGIVLADGRVLTYESPRRT